jgi:hypothetical protein
MTDSGGPAVTGTTSVTEPTVEPIAVRRALDEHGFVVIPGYLPAAELEPALADLAVLFPTADDFHRGADGERSGRFRDDQFRGIDHLPFASAEWSLLAVHDRIIDLAAHCLDTDDLRLYAAEAWAKYTGAADYEQRHHRDFFDHTPDRRCASLMKPKTASSLRVWAKS